LGNIVAQRPDELRSKTGDPAPEEKLSCSTVVPREAFGREAESVGRGGETHTLELVETRGLGNLLE